MSDIATVVPEIKPIGNNNLAVSLEDEGLKNERKVKEDVAKCKQEKSSHKALRHKD